MIILRNFPLMILPLIIYNLYSFGFMSVEGDIWPGVIATFSMLSGAEFSFTRGGLVIVIALFLLFIEILKATRTAQTTILDHLLSTALFVIFLLQFLIDSGAATTTFLILTVIAFLDVVAGFSVSIRVASRDVTLDRGF